MDDDPRSRTGSTTGRAMEFDGLIRPRPGTPGEPAHDHDGAAFHEPWEVRAVGVVAGLVDQGLFTWPEFQGALIEAVASWERRTEHDNASWSYYACWEQALEGLVVSRGALATSEVDERTLEFLSGKRTPPHTHGGGLLASFPASGA